MKQTVFNGPVLLVAPARLRSTIVRVHTYIDLCPDVHL